MYKVLSENIGEEIEKLISKAMSVSICSPFISESKVMEIVEKRHIDFKLVFKLCKQSPDSVVMHLAKDYPNQIHFYLDGDNFHSKMIIIDDQFIIVGSSNFTNGGLYQNKEINIIISKEETVFKDLVEVFERYWNDTNLLSCKIADAFKEEKRKLDKTPDAFSVNLLESIVPLIKIHSHNYNIEDVRLKAVRAALSKPVVKLNNGRQYNAILEAAKVEYNKERSYGYISSVCHKQKNDYKGDVWRFKDDYEKMSDVEINELVNRAKKEKYKEVELYWFDGRKFETEQEIVDYLNERYGIKITREKISWKFRTAEKLGTNYCKINVGIRSKVACYAKYYRLYSKGAIVEEVEVEKSFGEMIWYYEKLDCMQFGDCTAADILLSTKDRFYKYEGQYYKNRSAINALYDREITKNEASDLIFGKDWKRLQNIR